MASVRVPTHIEQQVTDYLLKRGFTQTERIFRKESADLGPDGRPKHDKIDQLGAKKYAKAFTVLRDWVENNLDIYKVLLGLDLVSRLRD
jgi:transcription initiation factor TFIID subunit 5